MFVYSFLSRLLHSWFLFVGGLSWLFGGFFVIPIAAVQGFSVAMHPKANPEPP